MSAVAITQEQQARLQTEVQKELEKREWAEPGDNVMAEYITVLIANGSDQSRVHTEMDDLVGADFDAQFLDWLFSKALEIQRSDAPRSPRPISPVARTSDISQGRDRDREPTRERERERDSGRGGSRMLNSALAPLGQDHKRKAGGEYDDGPRKVSRDAGRGAPIDAPFGPRAMGPEGRGLADRLSGRRGPGGGMQVRGAGGRPPPNMGGMNMNMNQMNQMGGFQPGFPPNMMGQPGFNGFFPPGQQEMMAQMMMMQANMAQMGEMMTQMMEQKESVPPPAVTSIRPTRPPPAKIPHGTKLGAHSVSAVNPKSAAPGPIPDKPLSKALCRYSVGCSNARCTFSHPSPAADEKTGMVLSEEPCENGKGCKDAECTKSHVSPAAVLGESAGPSRLLCKYLNCTNPSCAFRHEDAEGNPIPPPALTAAKAAKEAKSASIPQAPPNPSSDNEDGDGDFEVVMHSKGLMDGALDDSKPDKPCRYGERCTRPDCKFTHPPSRATPKPRGSYNSRGGGAFGKSTNVSTTGMNISKKFGTATNGATSTTTTLDPAAGDFVPKAEKELSVTS